MKPEELSRLKSLLLKTDLKKEGLNQEEFELIAKAPFAEKLEKKDRIRAIEFLLQDCAYSAKCLEYDAQEYESELQEKLQELKGVEVDNPAEENHGFGEQGDFAESAPAPASGDNEEGFGFDDPEEENGIFGFGDDDKPASVAASSHKTLAGKPNSHSHQK